MQGAGAANGGLALDLWHVVDLGISPAAIRELPAGTVVAAEVSDGERDPRPARRSMRDRRLPGDGTSTSPASSRPSTPLASRGRGGSSCCPPRSATWDRPNSPGGVPVDDRAPWRGAAPGRQGDLMRAVVTHRAGTMGLADVPEPADPGPGQVLVRPEAVGICGSTPLPDRRDRDPARVRSPVPARPGSRGGRKGRGAVDPAVHPTRDRPAGRTVPHVVVRRVLRVHPRPAERLPELPDHRRARRGRRSPTT